MGIKSKLKKVLLLVTSLMLLASCAQTQVALDKKEFSPFKEFSKQTNFPVSIPVLTLNVTDARKDGRFLGMAKTGASYTDTPLVPATDTKSFLTNYYREQLQKRGLVLSDQSESEIEIVINSLWVDELQEKFKGERAKCNVSIDVFAKKSTATFKGNYWTNIKSAGGLDDGTDLLAPTLASCLNITVEKIAMDKKLQKFLR